MEQHLELQSLGILRQTKVPLELSWMSDIEKQFLLELSFAGQEGLHKRFVTKQFKKTPELLLNLEVRGMVQWESDKRGIPTFLVLSWKGIDAANLLLQIAKNESHRRVG